MLMTLVERGAKYIEKKQPIKKKQGVFSYDL
jgi:hypothetical protein